MDATAAPQGELDRFLSVGLHLRDIGLSAPQVFAENSDYLLLEDFGDMRFADLPTDQSELYKLALDVLSHVQAQPAPSDLPHCDAAHLGTLAATAWQWYPKFATGTQDHLFHEVADQFREFAFSTDLAPSCMMLRDYHAENLMWLPQREGIRRAGLLDYQDAMLGHPAFDVVSLLQDARRDVEPDFERAMCAYFAQTMSMTQSDFYASYAALGAIRNLRIIGMFARLARHLGRPEYVDFIPRVWEYLDRDLAHPALEPVRALVLESLPPPSDAHLQMLRDTCSNSQHP
jgi:aminoglycoside/choline kinase family phosphotransferase